MTTKPKQGMAYYRYIHKRQEINLAFDDGGLGDGIARLPIIPYILENHPHVVIFFYVPVYFESIAKRSLPKHRNLTIYNLNQALNSKKLIPLKSFYKMPYLNLATHMTDHAFRAICNAEVDPKYKNYLPINTKSISVKRFNLPEKFVVMTVANTANVRKFLPEHINEINKFIKSKGYEVVFLGKRETSTAVGLDKIYGMIDEKIDFDIGINLIDKTTILETTQIIKQSSGIVGLDNGLLHVAGTTEVPIIGGFTTVDPAHRMPYRHGEMGWNYYPVILEHEELPCRYCQSNMTMIFGHDFRECIYDDFKCLSMLNAEKYIEQLEKIL